MFVLNVMEKLCAIPVLVLVNVDVTVLTNVKVVMERRNVILVMAQENVTYAMVLVKSDATFVMVPGKSNRL